MYLANVIELQDHFNIQVENQISLLVDLKISETDTNRRVCHF
jgi:hypothetical protein